MTVRKGSEVFNSFEETIKAIELLIINNCEITAIEFSLVSEAMKLSYFYKFLKKKDEHPTMPMWLFSWYATTDKKRLEVINIFISKKWRIKKDMLDVCDKSSIEKYMDYRIKGDVSSYELQYLNERQIAEYLNYRVDNGQWLEFNEFEKLSEKYKLLFILKHGLNNLDSDTGRWFTAWQKAKGRDIQIDKILLD